MTVTEVAEETGMSTHAVSSAAASLTSPDTMKV